MAYVAIGIVLLLVLAAFITFLVMAQTKESSPAAAEEGAETQAAPFSGPDETPLGDTAQHAGEQTAEGETVGQNDASARGGTGDQTSGPHSAGHAPAQVDEEPPGGRFKRDPIGGEGEGTTAIEAPDATQSGRDASRS